MAFASVSFLSVFLPVTFLICVLCCRWVRVQNACLLAASLFFYAWGDAGNVLLLIACGFANHFFAVSMNWAEQENRRKRMLFASVAFNMLMLFGFKYAGFAVQSINALLGLQLPVPQIALPLGISFFTFQGMSYVLDVYRRKTEPAPSGLSVLLYLALFPQLIAGPIVKWQRMAGQLAQRSITAEGAAAGLRRAAFGLAKKVLLADTLGRVVDLAFSAPVAGLSAPLAWLGAFAHTLQIYLDFSGYSDMAIGLGLMLGFTLPENFALPLCADTMRHFWQRWHITLTDWFREYFYDPLGGSRKHAARNLMLVFLFTGLWHGANVTFVVWGIYHGLFVMAEHFGWLPVKRFSRVLRSLYVLMVTVIGFVIFRADSLSQAGAYLSGMLRFAPMDALQYSYLCEALSLSRICMLLAAIPVCFAGKRLFGGKLNAKLDGSRMQWLGYLAAFVLICLSYASLLATGYHPFLYFRF